MGMPSSNVKLGKGRGQECFICEKPIHDKVCLQAIFKIPAVLFSVPVTEEAHLSCGVWLAELMLRRIHQGGFVKERADGSSAEG